MKLTRINKIGQTYEITGEPGESRIIVSTKGKHMDLNMEINEFSQRWYNWQVKGDYLQIAFDVLNPEQREFLLTGITPDEWKEIFKDVEGEY